MAEAAGASAVSKQFFCHVCNLNIVVAGPNYCCPHCNGGFIEELPLLRDTRSESDSNSRSGQNRLEAISGSNEESQTGLNTIRRSLFSILNRANGPSAMQLRTLLREASQISESPTYTYDIARLLVRIGIMPPPPLTDAMISILPQVKINSEDLEKKLQCAICWEAYSIEETVLELPCSHKFHVACLVPWLKIYATCPVCRHCLVELVITSMTSLNELEGATSNSTMDAVAADNNSEETPTTSNTSMGTRSSEDNQQENISSLEDHSDD